MSYTRTAIATATIVISLAAAGPGTQPASASGGLAGSLSSQDWTSSRPALQAPEAAVAAPVFATEIIAETDEQFDNATAALEQMEAAGFELPPVTVYMHSDRANCSSDPNRVLNGYFVQIEGENIVHSCGNQWTLLHELTHVWDKNVLDDATRDKIMTHQGLDSWNSGTWNHAGGEHLASIVAWAIEGTHPTRIGYYDRDHLAEAYEIVTGQQPPTMQDNAPIVASAAATVTIATTTTAAQLPE